MGNKDFKEEYEKLLREGERYKTIICYYQNNLDRLDNPQNEAYFREVCVEAKRLTDFILKFEKGEDFQKSIKLKNDN